MKIKNIIFIVLLVSLLMVGCRDKEVEKNDKVNETEIEDSDISISQFLINNESLIKQNQQLVEENENLQLEIRRLNDSDEGLDTAMIIEHPIDAFFSEHPNYAQGKASSMEYSELYANTWKEEMNYAFDILLANSNELYLEDVNKLRELFIEVTELNSEIHVLSFISNAFQGMPDNEHLTYGSDFYFFLYEVQASNYKSYTDTIHDYLDFSEIEYDHGFKAESLLKEMEKYKKQ